MPLIRGIARTAVVAGTATAVSNRVSRRQGNRWAEQEQAAAYEAEQQDALQQQRADLQAPAPDRVAQLKELASLRDSGVLTEQEFAAEKARILG
jgi:hypothetical protein